RMLWGRALPGRFVWRSPSGGAGMKITEGAGRSEQPLASRLSAITVGLDGDTAALAGDGPEAPPLPPLGRAFVDNLVRLGLLTPSAAGKFLDRNVGRLSELDGAESCGQALIADGLLTPYQLGQIMAGATHALVLGHYRVLGRLGAGGMGIVYLGEHILM